MAKVLFLDDYRAGVHSYYPELGERKPVSAPVIKCKKTPRKKCSLVAEEAKKR